MPPKEIDERLIPLAPSARGLRPQAVGERTLRQTEIFRFVARFSPSGPAGPSLPLWRKRHLPRTGGACLAEGGKEYHKNAQYHSKTGPPNSIAITMPAHRNGPKAKWSFFPAFLAASR